LTRLPPEISDLADLRELTLNGNQLTSLPPQIGRLTNLKALRLDGNQLTSLPWELADLLANGLDLNLAGNPLTDPLPELAARGPAAYAEASGTQP